MISELQLNHCLFLAETSRLQEPLESSLKAVLCGTLLAKTLQNCFKDSEKFLKVDASPVTVADLAVQAVMLEILTYESNGSRIRVVAEEDFASLSPDVLNQVIDRLNLLCPLAYLRSKLRRHNKGIKNVNNDLLWTSEGILNVFNNARLCSNNDVDRFVKEIPDKKEHWSNSCYFVIDPIDGTKGFLRHGQFAIGLCLVDGESGVPQIGIIGAPNLPETAESAKLCEKDALSASRIKMAETGGQIFFGVKEEGSKCVAIKDLLDTHLPILKVLKVKNTLESLESLTCLESYEANHTNFSLSQQTLVELGVDLNTCRVLRSDSMVKYGVLARGDGHVFMRFPRSDYYEKVWDVLPGLVVLEEAGGTITHSDGTRVDARCKITLTNTSGLIMTGAGGKDFHNKVIQAVESARSKIKSCTV